MEPANPPRSAATPRRVHDHRMTRRESLALLGGGAELQPLFEAVPLQFSIPADFEGLPGVRYRRSRR